jgi:hypothetical protein
MPGYIISHLTRAPNNAFYAKLGMVDKVVCKSPNYSPRMWLDRRMRGSWEMLRLADGNFNLYRNSLNVTRHIREMQYRFRRRRQRRHIAALCFWVLDLQPLMHLVRPYL